MVSNSTYSIITAVAARYVPDKQHKLLHINPYDVWVETIAVMIDKGALEPKMAVLVKCAQKWEEFLTFKYSRLN
jgi:hypothetical protein